DQTKISMLAPVTLPGHSTGGIIDPDRLDEAIGEGGELSRIRKLLENKELGLAVDPRAIASFEAAVAEPPADAQEPEHTEGPGDGGELGRLRNMLENKDRGLAVNPPVIASFEAAVAERAADGQEPEDTEGPGDEGTETQQAGVADSDDDASAAEIEAEEDQRKR